jgi:GT2 family glycosyltransferase
MLWCCEVELSEGGRLTAPTPPPDDGRPARVIARLHGEPLGYLTVPTDAGGVDLDGLSAAAWRQFPDRIRAHLGTEGLSTDAPDRPPPANPSCPNAPTDERPVTVIVCTRDRTAQLRRCLERLTTLSYDNYDILVVDNAPSDDATRVAVAEIAVTQPRLRYLREPVPGVSAARNCGLRAASGEILAYTDDDVEVDPGWLNGLVRGFRRREDVGCVTGLVCTAEIVSDSEAYFDARAAYWSRRFDPELFDAERRPDSSLYPYSPGLFGTGANFAVDRNLITEVGGFDEALGAGTPTLGGEDLDVFLRILQARRAIAFEPAALVWHHHRADSDALLRQMYGYGTGLGALVTKLLRDPLTRRDILRRVPAGVARLGVINRDTTREATAAVPAGVRRRELTGLLAGPARYARSRRAEARRRRSLA